MKGGSGRSGKRKRKTKSVRIDKKRALAVLEEEAALAEAGEVDAEWASRVRELRTACEGGSRTHIAALGTALLARATNLRANPLSLKVKSGVRGAYSARSLAKDVLAPNAARLGIDLGVTGREPLNNQPYFRYDAISRDMDVKGSSRKALGVLCDALEVLRATKSEPEARAALRAFLRESRRAPVSVVHRESDLEAIGDFSAAVAAFVARRSEGGKCAQAVAAGLLDTMFNEGRVVTARVNDPDRRFPGDIAVLDVAGAEIVRAIEVRDKPVSESDLDFMVEKCAEGGVGWAGVLAVDPGQAEVDPAEAGVRANRRGIELAVFQGWRGFIEATTFWSGMSAREAIAAAHSRAFARMVEVEASEEALEAWNALAEGP